MLGTYVLNTIYTYLYLSISFYIPFVVFNARQQLAI